MRRVGRLCCVCVGAVIGWLCVYLGFGAVLSMVARDRLAPGRATVYPLGKCAQMDERRRARRGVAAEPAGNRTLPLLLMSYYVPSPGSGEAESWASLASSTLENHEAYALLQRVAYVRASPPALPPTYHRRCGKLRAVHDNLRQRPYGSWLVFADADVAFACSTGTSLEAGVAHALRVARKHQKRSGDLVDLVVAERFGLFAVRHTRWALTFLLKFADALDAKPALCMLSTMPENAIFNAIVTPADLCRLVFVSDPPLAISRHLVGDAKKDDDRAAAFALRADVNTACLLKEAARVRPGEGGDGKRAWAAFRFINRAKDAIIARRKKRPANSLFVEGSSADI